MLIQIIGLGCPNCRRLEADVVALVEALGLDAHAERIDDPHKIVSMGIVSLPQLVVDGQVVSRGYQHRRQVEQALRKALL